MKEAATRLGLSIKSVRLWCFEWERYGRRERISPPSLPRPNARRLNGRQWFIAEKWVANWLDPETKPPEPIAPPIPEPIKRPSAIPIRRRIVGYGMD